MELAKEERIMDQIVNRSVAALAETICKQQQENGFATSAIDRTLRYANISVTLWKTALYSHMTKGWEPTSWMFIVHNFPLPSKAASNFLFSE